LQHYDSDKLFSVVTAKILIDEDEAQAECAKAIQVVLTNKTVLHNIDHCILNISIEIS